MHAANCYKDQRRCKSRLINCRFILGSFWYITVYKAFKYTGVNRICRFINEESHEIKPTVPLI